MLFIIQPFTSWHHPELTVQDPSPKSEPCTSLKSWKKLWIAFPAAFILGTMNRLLIWAIKWPVCNFLPLRVWINETTTESKDVVLMVPWSAVGSSELLSYLLNIADQTLSDVTQQTHSRTKSRNKAAKTAMCSLVHWLLFSRWSYSDRRTNETHCYLEWNCRFVETFEIM